MSKSKDSDAKVLMLYIYMNGCPYCVEFDDVWKQVSTELQHEQTHIQFKKIEQAMAHLNGDEKLKQICDEWKSPQTIVGRPYPCIIRIQFGSPHVVYKGPRTVEAFKKFAMSGEGNIEGGGKRRIGGNSMAATLTTSLVGGRRSLSLVGGRRSLSLVGGRRSRRQRTKKSSRRIVKTRGRKTK
jgi:hypothetical protein